jgi:hypothetical protein
MEGLKVIPQLLNFAAVKVTALAKSFGMALSTPMLPKKEEVLKAGPGFNTFETHNVNF